MLAPMSDDVTMRFDGMHAQRRAMLAGLGGLAAGSLLARGASAGPLNPPPGPVAPTPGPEPRIAINQTNTPGNAGATFRITQPGSYYLEGNLFGEPGKRGIEIAASDVTIDLRGFAMLGGGSLDGIATSGNRINITIRNGIVRNWGGDGVNLVAGGGEGDGALVENLHLRVNDGAGLRVGNSSIVRNCIAEGNQNIGIVTAERSVIAGCIASDNALWGIIANGRGSVARECVASGNGFSAGIQVASGVVEDCVAFSNNDSGISCIGSIVSRCVALSNMGIGILCDTGSIVGCRSFNNEGFGIRVTRNSVVSECFCSDNMGGDILALQGFNRIDGNQCRSATQGIVVEGTRNLIVRNACFAGASSYVIAADNRYGPIVDVSAPGSPAVSGASAPATIGTTHPWANLSH